MTHIGSAIHAYSGESRVQTELHQNGGPPQGALAMTGMDVLLLAAGATLILLAGIAVAWWQNHGGH